MAGHSKWSGSEGILVKAMTRLRPLVVELGKYGCVSRGIRYWIIADVVVFFFFFFWARKTRVHEKYILTFIFMILLLGVKITGISKKWWNPQEFACGLCSFQSVARKSRKHRNTGDTGV